MEEILNDRVALLAASLFIFAILYSIFDYFDLR